jgi:2-methylisocitrate lyase-like PEP mutase family enzyme
MAIAMTKRLRELLARPKVLMAPGAADALTARLIAKHGFEAIYMTGAGTTAVRLGMPDVGLLTMNEMVDNARAIAEASQLPLIADADTGYGGLLNVHHTVRGYEEAGVTAIQIEDQEFPKRCGHTPNKRCVPLEDMVEKIKVAVEAREDKENFLIIARTDARAGLGVDEAMRRMDAYAEAGADILFFEAPQSEEEMRRACEAFDKPMLANMANGGKTPILPAKVLEEIGYSLAIYPAMTSLVAAAAIEKSLRMLKEQGLSETPDIDMFDFNEFCKLIGFEEVWDFEKRWAR